MLFDFDEKTKRITCDDISNAIKKFDDIDDFEDEKQIMSMIFQMEPRNRPTCIDILNFLGVSCKIPKLYTIPQKNKWKKVSRMRINTNDAIQKYIDNIIDNCLCDVTGSTLSSVTRHKYEIYCVVNMIVMCLFDDNDEENIQDGFSTYTEYVEYLSYIAKNVELKNMYKDPVSQDINA